MTLIHELTPVSYISHAYHREIATKGRIHKTAMGRRMGRRRKAVMI